MVFLDDAKTNMWLELQRQRVIPFRRDTSSLILASSVRQQYSLGRSRDGFQEIARHAWRAVLAAGSMSSGLAQRCRIELLAAIDQNTRSATPNAALHFGRKWPCSEASCHSSGWKSRQQRSPVTVVVISSDGEGDRSVESLEVKVPEGWAFQSDPYRGASNLAGCSGSEPVKPRNRPPVRNGLRECRECRAGGHSAKANVGIEVLDIDVKLPGVGEGGTSGRNVQRKLGTTRGSPRRSRTAKASRISRHAVKSRCACEWGG